ncbi:hypothetical protein HYFRA_00003907 [Hymenoscyphus fraxineus]|uniref:Uncharacterized protein n=1 Tax=Hymenoscyphus fraxineus TaxID=746836 RepID=A0A9N9L2I1_9HELO|nr:hypothetical protein HYFRA_00003907 [Hymenoscyphus fraxineus]
MYHQSFIGEVDHFELNYGRIAVPSVPDEKGRNVEYMLAQAYSLEGDDMEPPIVSNENGGEQAHVEFCPSQHLIIPNDTADQVGPSARSPHKNKKACLRQMLALKQDMIQPPGVLYVASSPRTSLAISEDELCKVRPGYTEAPIFFAKHIHIITRSKRLAATTNTNVISLKLHICHLHGLLQTGHKLIPLLPRLSSLQHEETSNIYKSIHDEKDKKNMNIYSHEIQLRLPATSVKIG